MITTQFLYCQCEAGRLPRGTVHRPLYRLRAHANNLIFFFCNGRVWRGAVYAITVENPGGTGNGVKECHLNGAPLAIGESSGAELPAGSAGSLNQVRVTLY
jgi:hypothetical protein